jgi:hypothetical protein
MDEILTDADFDSDIVTDSDFAPDAPAQTQPRDYSLFRSEFASPQLPEGYGRGDLFSNKETGFAGEVARSLPASAGATIGGALLSPVLPPFGTMAGAAIGGFVGEGARQIGVDATNPEETSLAEGGKRAATGGVLQGITGAVGAAAGALKPVLKKLGGQALRVGPNIKPQLGEAALGGSLERAPGKERLGQLYEQFQSRHGLASPTLKRARDGNIIFNADDAEGIVNLTFQKLHLGNQVSNQELYSASQAASHLKRMAKYGNQNQAANMGNIVRAKEAFDKALEASAPGYGQLRQQAFDQKVADQFQSFFPLNQNGEPNVLRPAYALSNLISTGLGAATGASVGGPVGAGLGAAAGAAALPFLISPRIAGAAINTARAVAPAAKVTYRVAAPTALEEAYRSIRGR